LQSRKAKKLNKKEVVIRDNDVKSKKRNHIKRHTWTHWKVIRNEHQHNFYGLPTPEIMHFISHSPKIKCRDSLCSMCVCVCACTESEFPSFSYMYISSLRPKNSSLCRKHKKKKHYTKQNNRFFSFWWWRNDNPFFGTALVCLCLKKKAKQEIHIHTQHKWKGVQTQECFYELGWNRNRRAFLTKYVLVVQYYGLIIRAAEWIDNSIPNQMTRIVPAHTGGFYFTCAAEWVS